MLLCQYLIDPPSSPETIQLSL
uniref:Uncharacterized protein n=1 Tax=Rhizophora mucronata TaxID=61149 RepID=A0A2P2LTE2_RHIMU